MTKRGIIFTPMEDRRGVVIHYERVYPAPSESLTSATAERR